MLGMGWSWLDLETTPDYVKRYCADFLSLKRQADADAVKKQSRAAGGGYRG